MAGGFASPAAVNWSGTEAVYTSAYRELLRVAYVLTGSGAAAEDVVQDVFCRVGPRIAELENPAAYLRVAVVNQCRSIHRRVVRAPRLDVPRPVLDGRLVELQDALRKLNERQRTAVVMRYLCDVSDEEIADLIGCRVATGSVNWPITPPQQYPRSVIYPCVECARRERVRVECACLERVRACGSPLQPVRWCSPAPEPWHCSWRVSIGTMSSLRLIPTTDPSTAMRL